MSRSAVRVRSSALFFACNPIKMKGPHCWCLQALGRPPVGVEELGLGEDGAEDDRTLLLAQHTRLVAGSEEALHRCGIGQRVDAARGLRHFPPSVSYEPGQIPRQEYPSAAWPDPAGVGFSSGHLYFLRRQA